ncbi:MAG: hypothetical protein J6T57_03115 [Alphaproteobacteria bacterium]|nr:hypothetical protein [Alphaproteobacteria bacterium]
MPTEKVPDFKNTYVIDMDALHNKPLKWTARGILLPIKLKNGVKPKSSTESEKLFTERPVLRMIEQYPVLFPMVNRNANTITEYVDTNGNSLVSIYPNNDIETHDQDWKSHLGMDAMKDLVTLYKEHKATMDSARGALSQIKQK